MWCVMTQPNSHCTNLIVFIEIKIVFSVSCQDDSFSSFSHHLVG
jgi:hypothetical protein